MRRMKTASIALLMALIFLSGGSGAWAALEDTLYEKGIITKEDWLKAKADKEKEEAARDKLAADAKKGVVTHATARKTWIDSVVWSGDLRLRHEQFWRYGNQGEVSGYQVAVDRNRQRFRLRIGPEIRMGDFRVIAQVGTSQSTDGVNGDQVSHNQSFDNAFSQKEFFILQAYGSWNPSFFKPMTLYGGKIKNPFYQQYTNDLLFDADVNPEGAAENFTFKVTDSLTLFTNFGQFILDEDSADTNDQYMIGYQGGIETRFGDHRIRLTAGFFDALKLNTGGISEPTLQQFNSRAGAANNAAAYVNDYDVLHLTALFETSVIGFPLEILGDYVKNTTGVQSCANNANNTFGRCAGFRVKDQDMGYQVGLRFGRASKARTWELAYYYKWLQADAVLSAFADSDFGDGGTNRRGNIVWVGYSFTDFLNFRVKLFNTKPLERTLCGTNNSCRDQIDRLQVDMVWAF